MRRFWWRIYDAVTIAVFASLVVCFLASVCHSQQGATPPIPYSAILSDIHMANTEMYYLMNIIEDIDFMCENKPTPTSFASELLTIKSTPEVESKGGRLIRLPSVTLREGGDCDDLAGLAIMRLFQLKKSSVGFMILAPAIVTASSAHIVAIYIEDEYEQPSDIKVAEFGGVGTLSIDLYLTGIAGSDRYDYIRLWWFFNETQLQIKSLERLRGLLG